MAYNPYGNLMSAVGQGLITAPSVYASAKAKEEERLRMEEDRARAAQSQTAKEKMQAEGMAMEREKTGYEIQKLKAETASKLSDTERKEALEPIRLFAVAAKARATKEANEYVKKLLPSVTYKGVDKDGLHVFESQTQDGPKEYVMEESDVERMASNPENAEKIKAKERELAIKEREIQRKETETAARIEDWKKRRENDILRIKASMAKTAVGAEKATSWERNVNAMADYAEKVLKLGKNESWTYAINRVPAPATGTVYAKSTLGQLTLTEKMLLELNRAKLNADKEGDEPLSNKLSADIKEQNSILGKMREELSQRVSTSGKQSNQKFTTEQVNTIKQKYNALNASQKAQFKKEHYGKYSGILW